MTYLSVFGAMAIGVAALALDPPAAHAMPLAPANIGAAAPSEIVFVRHRYRRHYRSARRYYWGGARRGNINGCSIDLGYGRYEPCNR